MEERDLYQVLQVDPLASREIIAEAYWVLARKAQALRTEEQMTSEVLHQLNLAYSTLVNPNLRLSYNQTLAPHRPNGPRSVPGDNQGRRPSLLQRMLGRENPLIGRKRRNLYRILLVGPHAEPEVIAAAYACLRQQYREGVWSSQADQEALDELTEAFSVLADRDQRAAYDAGLPALRREEESTPEPSPPSVADEPETAPRDFEDKPHVVSHAGVKIAAGLLAVVFAITLAWAGALALAVILLLAGVLALGLVAGRHHVGRNLYRGMRGLAEEATKGAAALVEQRDHRPPAPPPADMDRVVRERLSAKSFQSIQATPQETATETAGEPAAPMARLMIYGGLHSGSAFILTDRPISLGADSECDVILEAQEHDVAPLHARIWYREGRFMIHLIADEKSLTAGRAQAWGVLEDGDELRIGHHRLTFELIPPSEDVPSANGDEENSSDKKG